MAARLSRDHIRFIANRLKGKLWLKPLWMCICSVFAVFVAKIADRFDISFFALPLSLESLVTLLEIMSSSMLVIATFSVGSMLSAYASATNSATPRAFTLVVSDDVSKNALSRFIGSFIFSIVALTAVKNEFFNAPGLWVLFILTALVFALVVLTFIRWVDRLARLGRVGNTIDRVEKVAMESLVRNRNNPTLSGVACVDSDQGDAVVATEVGYIQHVDISCLHHWAETNDLHLILDSLPGDFVAPGTTLARVLIDDGKPEDFDYKEVIAAFQIGVDRIFDDDPRFGLIALSEIASKALSPAVNDPGSAIKVIGSLVRVFAAWSEPVQEKDQQESCFDRVQVPKVNINDMFNDAFTPIARDGAGCLEVVIHLQKALSALHLLGDTPMKEAAKHHAEMSLKRSEPALTLAEDLQSVRNTSIFKS